MLTSEFWKLIDTARKRAGGDAEAQLDELCTLLGDLEPNDLIAFDTWLRDYHQRAYTWGLWGAAYLIGGGCSDDGFMDFRGWLISRGEQVFTTALAQPDSLATVVKESDGECQVEGYLYLPADVWAAKTGRPRDEFPAAPVDACDSGPAGVEWREDELDALLPKLARKFG